MAETKTKNVVAELTEVDQNNVLSVFGKNYVIPKSWGELTDSYIWGWIEAIRLGVNQKEFLQFILIYAIGIKKELNDKLETLSKKDKTTVLSELFRASELLSFMLGENGLSFNEKKVYKGMTTPNTGLTNFTAIEFILSTTYFKQFGETGEVEYLNKLCSILLRASQKKDRKDYSEAEEHYSLCKVKELTIQERLIIWKMFEGEFIALAKQYQDIFSSKDEQEEISYPYDLITNLAGDKFGTIEEVEKRNIHILFQYIMQKNKEVQEAENKNNNDELG